MTSQFKTYGAMTALALLAACGGGGGGGPKTVFNYQTFDSTVPGTSTIAAAGLTRTDPDAYPDGTTVEVGTLERGETSVLTIAGIVTSGTQNPDGSWTSGTTTVAESDILVGNFNFLIPVTVTEDGAEKGTYIVGVVARGEDPPTGEFRYEGTARVEGILDSASVTPLGFGSDGALLMTADFANQLVDIDISGLTEGDIPFYVVSIDDLSISSGADATFSSTNSSTFTFADSFGEAYNPDFGGSATESASGAFFGGDESGPVEAGGAFSVTGTNGNTIYGIFAADARL